MQNILSILQNCIHGWYTYTLATQQHKQNTGFPSFFRPRRPRPVPSMHNMFGTTSRSGPSIGPSPDGPLLPFSACRCSHTRSHRRRSGGRVNSSSPTCIYLLKYLVCKQVTLTPRYSGVVSGANPKTTPLSLLGRSQTLSRISLAGYCAPLLVNWYRASQ